MNLKTLTTTAALAALLPASGHAVLADFTETYDGGTYDIATPILNTDDLGPPTLTLENDALTVVSAAEAGGGSGRAAALLDVTNSQMGPGISVTQSVDVLFPELGFGDVVRAGFVFGVTDAANSTQGPSDAVYVFLSEPSGQFGTAQVGANWFDADEGEIFINSDDTEDDTFTPLASDTLYTLTATLSYVSPTEFDVAVTVDDANGQVFDYGVVLTDAGATGASLDGTLQGLYFSNFSTDSSIVFDNYRVSVVPEPAAAMMLGGLGLAALRRRRG
jgi:MYXO-CTERM domain-containing protein